MSLGWSLAIGFGIYLLYGLDTEGYMVDGKMPPWSLHVIYGGFARLIYGGCLAWMIFACVHGYGGKT